MRAGRYAEGAAYNPLADGPCVPQTARPLGGGATRRRTGHGCVALSDEFFQYWLGAYENAPAGGSTAGQIATVDGVRAPFDGLSWSFSDGGIAPGRNAAAYSATAETIGATYPAVSGRTAARYRGLAGAIRRARPATPPAPSSKPPGASCSASVSRTSPAPTSGPRSWAGR